MANNRYYLHCPHCGDSKWFAKSLGLYDYKKCDCTDPRTMGHVPFCDYKTRKENAVYNYGTVTAEDVMQFINDHIECTPWDGSTFTPEWYDGTFIEIISEYDKRVT